MHTSTRLGLDIVDTTDAQSSYPAVDAQAKAILDTAVLFSSGTLASRPTAALAGRVYYATDTKQFFDDDGTNWNLRIQGYPFAAYRNASMSLPNNTFTAIPMDTVITDVGGCYSSGNYSVPKTGVYLLTAQVATNAGAANGQIFCEIYKNGTTIVAESGAGYGTAFPQANLTNIVPLTSGDYLTLYAWQGTGSSLSTVSFNYCNTLGVQPLI